MKESTIEQIHKHAHRLLSRTSKHLGRTMGEQTKREKTVAQKARAAWESQQARDASAFDGVS